MNLPLHIALRYLFARKSHNVINIISAISAAGMAVGTAALILILSVYNGFDSIIADNMSDLEPDLLVSPSEGKVFIPEGEAFDYIYHSEDILRMTSTVKENVFISYGGRQGIAYALGMDSVWEEESPMARHLQAGKFRLHDGQIPECLVGSTLAYEMKISPRFHEPVQIWFPDREGHISIVDPSSSLRSEKAFPAGIVAINADTDKTLLVVPIELLRSLLGYADEVSTLELWLSDKARTRTVQKDLQQKLGAAYTVQDRYQQNPSLYKMMRYEKAAIFMILMFVVIIIAFSIFGSLQMLMIEKSDDIATLRSMGAESTLIRRIFVLEGWMISLLGLAAGLLIGLGLALAQQHFGIVKMPGNFLISTYPVVVKASDTLAVAGGVAAIGYLIACIPTIINKNKI